MAKISGLNPGNCNDAELLASIHDAIATKEKELHEEGRVDEYGMPLGIIDDDKWYQVAHRRMQSWFHEAMFSVDRIVGRYRGQRFYGAPEKGDRKGGGKGKNRDAPDTFRLGPYQVLRAKPVEVEQPGANGKKAEVEARQKMRDELRRFTGSEDGDVEPK